MRLSSRQWKVPFLSALLLAFLAGATPAPADDEEPARDREPAETEEARVEAPGEPAGRDAPPAGEEEESTLPFRVLGNFFFELPGLETHTLTPMQRKRFLQRVNGELCGCGSCSRDTVANCYINDPSCRFVRDQARKILNEVRAGQ